MVYANKDDFAVVAVHSDKETRVTASIASNQTEEAEEMAIALPIGDPGCRTVLSV